VIAVVALVDDDNGITRCHPFLWCRQVENTIGLDMGDAIQSSAKAGQSLSRPLSQLFLPVAAAAAAGVVVAGVVTGGGVAGVVTGGGVGGDSE
jgi:hypothetical protein